MAEENQVQQGPTGPTVPTEPQQVMKEPQGEAVQAQRVTTKDPKKVEAGKRLAAINHKKREVEKREEQAQLEKTTCRVILLPILWYQSCYSSGSDRWPWFLHLSYQERRNTK